MWIMLWMAASLAGELVVDAQVPTEVQVGGHTIAQLFQPAVLHFALAAGPTRVTLMVSGAPRDLDVTIPAIGALTIVVGRTGITAGEEPQPSVAGATGRVEFRVAGSAGVQVQVDEARHVLAPGQTLTLDLVGGPHRMSVRDRSGTLIWARGTLQIDGAPDPFVVQLSEGHAPEVAGAGGAFHPDGS
jgi:hypothetical protein